MKRFAAGMLTLLICASLSAAPGGRMGKGKGGRGGGPARKGQMLELIMRTMTPAMLAQLSPKVKAAVDEFNDSSALFRESLRTIMRSVQREARNEGVSRRDMTPEKLQKLLKPHQEELQDAAREAMDAYVAFQQVAIKEIKANPDKASQLFARQFISQLTRQRGKAGGRGMRPEKEGRGRKGEAETLPKAPVEEE